MEFENRRVSVIIPVFDCERYVGEAIQSALEQTLRPSEIIVVDDGSRDKTSSIVKEFFPRVRYHCQSHRGTGAARNAGVRLAKGDYLAHLDADDIWHKEKLALQMEAFAAHPGTDIVAGHAQQFYSPELGDDFKSKIKLNLDIIPGYIPSALVVKKESFFRVGWYETAWRVGQDVSWFMRAKEHNLKIVMIPELVLWRRVHENNKGFTQRGFIRDRLKILKASMDRRRNSGQNK